MQESAFTLIHYYDLNALLFYINQLNSKSDNLTKVIEGNGEYKNETINHVKILHLIKERVDSKINEILPHPKRIKRGLINGLGSIFKSISGNLDASDGERYDKLINQLQSNQEKLANNIDQQNAISLNIVKQFNETVHKISTNEKMLENKINEIYTYIKHSQGHALIIKDYLNQLTNLYEIINALLQDVENSISFSRLNMMHPSIIQTNDLYKELGKIEQHLVNRTLPLKVTLQNTFILQSLIDVECYTLNNKITYVLKIPIVHQYYLNYYHLFSVPTYIESQFKAIIPRNKYLIKNELYYTFENNPCKKVTPGYYICKQGRLQNITEDNPCEIQLLDNKNPSNCHRVQISINKLNLERIGDTNQFIGLLPRQESIKLTCNTREETIRLIGTYLFDIPINCQITTSLGTFTNEKPISTSQSILLPKIGIDQSQETPKFNIELENVRLDELHAIKSQILNNKANIKMDLMGQTPSLWTLLIYVLLIFTVIYICYKKLIVPRCVKKRNQESPATQLSEVQLPR